MDAWQKQTKAYSTETCSQPMALSSSPIKLCQRQTQNMKFQGQSTMI